MEIVINKDCFSKAVSDVCKAISFKSSRTILTGIKLVVKEKCLIIVGSNSDIFIEKIVPTVLDGESVLNIIEKGSVVISAKYLSEIAKKLPGDIHIKVNHNQVVTIQSDGVVTSLNSFLSEEYPNLPNIADANFCIVPRQDLFEMIQQTAFAASTNDFHPVLAGVSMTFKENHLSFTATNSHRLAFKKIRINANINTNIIVPNKTLNELIKLIDEKIDNIHIFLTNTYIVFKANNVALFSRLIEGAYPSINGLLPQECKTTIVVNRTQFLKGIDRACLFASEWKNNNVQFEIKDDSKLIISSMSTEIGKIQETQSIMELKGDIGFRITLNGNFLLDVLKVIKEEEIRLNFNGSMKPVLVEPIENKSNYYLISPVRSN